MNTATAQTFMSANSKIRQRLERQIFETAGRDIYGADIPHIDREARFASVRSAITHLFHHTVYSGANKEWGDGISKIRDACNELLKNENIDEFYSPEHQARIKQALVNLVKAGRNLLNDNFAEDDIRRFVELSIAGRARFYAGDYGGHYNPDCFVAQNYVTLAALVADNFPAWQKTLNHEYLPA